MFKAERLQKIQELITKQNHMDINTLSKLLNVSNVTVRNDLKELEEKGILKSGDLVVFTAGVVDFEKRHEPAAQTNIMRIVTVE